MGIETAAPAEGENTTTTTTTDAGGATPDNVQTNGEAGEQGEGGREPLSAEEANKRYSGVREALRRERAERRADREQMANVQRELAEIRKTAQGAKTDDNDEDFDIPDPEADPMAALAALKKLAGRLTEQQRNEAQSKQRSTEEQKFIQGVQNHMREAEADFVIDHPDYYDAATHYKDQRRSELEDMGYRGQELAQALHRDLITIVHTARKNNADPAKAIYGLALKRGFRSTKGDRELETVERGRRSATEVPRGGANGRGFSIEALQKAEGADYHKLWADYEKKFKGGR